MRKIFLYFIALSVFCSCSNDETGLESVNRPEGMETEQKVDFIRLVDNHTQDAGLLKFAAGGGASQARVEWIVSDGFNLDTTQTVLPLENGKGELPIRWDGKLEEGNYGPQDMAFKAGVMITADGESQYFPLVWAYAVDSLKLSANLRSRAVEAAPRASSLRFVPKEVEMNSEIGATMVLVGTETAFAVLNYSSFTSNMNVNLVELPRFIVPEDGKTGFNAQLDFKWTDAGAPGLGFQAYVLVESDNGLIAQGSVKYGKAPTLVVDPVTISLPGIGGNNIAVSQITTNQSAWSAVSNQVWLRVTPAAGNLGTHALYFSADANPYAVERYATVKVTAGGLSQNITIVQKSNTSAGIVPGAGSVQEDWGDEQRVEQVID